MATPGKIVDNPISGEKVIFRVTQQETKGAYVEFDQIFGPQAGTTAEHIHLIQDEIYEILAGPAYYTINGVPHMAQKGETVTIPHGTYHTNPWNNANFGSGVIVHLLRTVRPALNTEIFYETLYGRVRDGYGQSNGQLDPIQMAVVGDYIKSETYFFPHQLPIFIQRIMIPVIAAWGRAMGYCARYEEYSGSES